MTQIGLYTDYNATIWYNMLKWTIFPPYLSIFSTYAGSGVTQGSQFINICTSVKDILYKSEGYTVSCKISTIFIHHFIHIDSHITKIHRVTLINSLSMLLSIYININHVILSFEMGDSAQNTMITHVFF